MDSFWLPNLSEVGGNGGELPSSLSSPPSDHTNWNVRDLLSPMDAYINPNLMTTNVVKRSRYSINVHFEVTVTHLDLHSASRRTA
jgi:hypothetical protein